MTSRPIPLVLASASPSRLATLRSAGIDPAVRVSGVDEEATLMAALAADPGLSPAGQVVALARAKARAAADASACPDGLVLGCDSMLELDGQIVGKPVDAADAVRRITAQSGRSTVLHTGHWLIDCRADPTLQAGGASSTVVHFAALTAAEIAAYVATGEPLAVAGAFTIDGLGGPFIRGIEGDHHGVVGLSLPLLRDLLGDLGLTIPDLWRSGLAG